MVNRSKSWWLQKAAAEGEWASPLHGAVGTLVGYIRPAPHDRVSVRKCDMEHFIEASREIPALLSERDALAAENARLREALTPSAETRTAYSGKFGFKIVSWDRDATERVRDEVAVPWPAIEEIMAAIRARALVEAPR